MSDQDSTAIMRALNQLLTLNAETREDINQLKRKSDERDERRSPNSVDLSSTSTYTSYPSNDQPLSSVHFQISMVSIDDFRNEVTAACIKNWCGSRTLNFLVGEPTRYFIYILPYLKNYFYLYNY